MPAAALSSPEPWVIALLAGSAGGALITSLFGILVKPWDLRQRLKVIESEADTKLKTDITRLGEEAGMRLRMEARAEAARLRQKYVNALQFQAELLKSQIEAVARMLADDIDTKKLFGWFSKIKSYGDGKLEIQPGQLMSEVEFSERCHYEFIFAMSTLYYTSVFFLFSQRILSLAPFSEADSEFSIDLGQSLRTVAKAFVVQHAAGDPQREAAMERDQGLWDTVQNSMGAIVRQEEWYLSYPDFCRLFINRNDPKRPDHIFRRTLDFYGAFESRDHVEQGQQILIEGRALLQIGGAKVIVNALDALLQLLHREQLARDSAEPAPRHLSAGA